MVAKPQHINNNALAASVEMYNGRPVIMLNNSPQYPLIYSLTDVPGGRWSWEELPKYNLLNFYTHGFRLFQVDLFFDHVWKANGNIDMDTAQKQLRGVLNACPDAAIFIRFHVTPPKWWMQQYPEENTIYADTTSMPDINWGLQRLMQEDAQNPTRTSLASAKWKTEAAVKLKEFLFQLKTIPEADHIAGIQVAGGVYGEWHYWGFINNEPDMSKPMLVYFKQWLKEKYKTNNTLAAAWNDKTVTFDNITLPSLPERTTTQAGIFRDPQSERKIIDYYEAQHNCVADDILLFCKVIKDNWPRAIITGAFYGYYYAVFGREAAGGHLAVEKLLHSDYIDYLSGPAAYYPDAKETGEVYRSRSLIQSVLLHHKLWLDEMDQQPPLLAMTDTAYTTSLLKSIANVQRNMLFSFTHGTGFWFYDFGPSGFNGGPRLNDHGSFGWWDEPSLIQAIEKWKKYFDSALQKPYSSDADVLLVHDTKSFYYTGSSKQYSYMSHWANNWIPPSIFESGALHDVIYLDDLDKVNIDQYKIIVFINTWVLNDAQKKLIKEKLATSNRSLVWLYAPGFCNEKELNKKFIEEVTGFSIRQIKTPATTVLITDSNVARNNRFTIWNNMVEPLFVVDKDANAVSYGHIEKTDASGFAVKKMKDHISWFLSLPVADKEVWRFLFKQSNIHIYEAAGDVLYGGNGILSIHTLQGGKRQIELKNGKRITIALAPNSTTVLNAYTGEVINN